MLERGAVLRKLVLRACIYCIIYLYSHVCVSVCVYIFICLNHKLHRASPCEVTGIHPT